MFMQAQLESESRRCRYARVQQAAATWLQHLQLARPLWRCLRQHRGWGSSLHNTLGALRGRQSASRVARTRADAGQMRSAACRMTLRGTRPSRAMVK
jgi:hypothetical protein